MGRMTGGRPGLDRVLHQQAGREGVQGADGCEIELGQGVAGSLGHGLVGVRARRLSSARTRSRISAAAFSVKVTAATDCIGTGSASGCHERADAVDEDARLAGPGSRGDEDRLVERVSCAQPGVPVGQLVGPRSCAILRRPRDDARLTGEHPGVVRQLGGLRAATRSGPRWCVPRDRRGRRPSSRSPWSARWGAEETGRPRCRRPRPTAPRRWPRQCRRVTG